VPTPVTSLRSAHSNSAPAPALPDHRSGHTDRLPAAQMLQGLCGS
jgi:hypothetical protein